MAFQSADITSPIGNAFGPPGTGRNPITQITKKVPQLGVPIPGPPSSGSGFVRPSFFAGPQRFATGRLGSEAIPSASAGVVNQLSNILPSPSFSSDYAYGWPTNPQIPYAKIVPRYQLPLLTAPQRYQLMITKKQIKDPLWGLNRNIGESRRYTELNIPAWNYIQAKSEKMPATRNDVLTAEDIWNKWGIEGVVRTEEGQEDNDSTDERGKERLINCIVRGYAYIYNTWGNQVRTGTKLYLILKKKQLTSKEEWILNPIGNDIQFISAGDRTELTPKPFQLCFWAHYQYDNPPDKILQYEDEFGDRHRGKAIYIGSAVDPPGSNQKTINNVNINITAILSQPNFHIFLDAIE